MQRMKQGKRSKDESTSQNQKRRRGYVHPYLLGIERGESGEVEVMDPSRRGAVEGHLPELHVLHHELVGALHVVERPPGVILAQILDEDLACPKRYDYYEIHRCVPADS